MDLTTAMMLTATAVFQEVETPLGAVSSFFPEGVKGPGEEVPQVPEREQTISDIAAAFRVFEKREAARSDVSRSDLYTQLRQVAKKMQQQERKQRDGRMETQGPA